MEDHWAFLETRSKAPGHASRVLTEIYRGCDLAALHFPLVICAKFHIFFIADESIIDWQLGKSPRSYIMAIKLRGSIYEIQPDFIS